MSFLYDRHSKKQEWLYFVVFVKGDVRFVISAPPPPRSSLFFVLSTDVQEMNSSSSTCVTLTQACFATSSTLTLSRSSDFM